MENHISATQIANTLRLLIDWALMSANRLNRLEVSEAYDRLGDQLQTLRETHRQEVDRLIELACDDQNLQPADQAFAQADTSLLALVLDRCLCAAELEKKLRAMGPAPIPAPVPAERIAQLLLLRQLETLAA